VPEVAEDCPKGPTRVLIVVVTASACSTGPPAALRPSRCRRGTVGSARAHAVRSPSGSAVAPPRLSAAGPHGVLGAGCPGRALHSCSALGARWDALEIHRQARPGRLRSRPPGGALSGTPCPDGCRLRARPELAPRAGRGGGRRLGLGRHRGRRLIGVGVAGTLAYLLYRPGADLGGLHRGSLDLVPLGKIGRIERRRSPPRLPGSAERNSSPLRGCTPDDASVPMTGGAHALE
jgi:hypothetical protein